MKRRLLTGCIFALASLVFVSVVQAAPTAGMADKVMTLKKALQQNQAALKQYQWIETVTVSKDGKQKSQKQYQCYYGVDGTLQKTEMNSTQDQGRTPRGPLRRAIMEDKKEEMADYMKEVMTLVKKYVPPQSDLIQAAKEANNISFKPNADGIQLMIQNYLQKGDLLTIGLNTAKPEVNALSVNTYTDNNPKEAVTMQVTFDNLPDGTSYSKQTVIDAKSKNVTITTVNSGYRKMN